MIEMENLFIKYSNHVFKYVQSSVKDVDIAQEIVQEIFFRACENHHIIQHLSDYKKKAWLMTVARNLSIDYWRKAQKLAVNKAFEGEDSLDFYTLENRLKIVIYDDGTELKALLNEMIKRLKSEHQKAIKLFYIEELGYKECSNVLGITEVAFASLLRRARKALLAEVLKVYRPDITNCSLTEKEHKMLIYWFDILDFPTNIEEEISSKSRNFFNGFSQNFENFRKYTYPKALDDFLISSVSLNKDTVAADFGCGLGNLTLKLSTKVSTVIAMDHSIEMLNVLKKSVEKCEFSNIRPISIDICSNLSDFYQTFNVGFCIMVLHHVFDPKAVLQELARTLAPGGELIIADLAYTDENWIYKDAHDLWSGFKKSQLQEWIKKAGLNIIHLEEKHSIAFRPYEKQNYNKRKNIPLIYAHCVKQG